MPNAARPLVRRSIWECALLALFVLFLVGSLGCPPLGMAPGLVATIAPLSGQPREHLLAEEFGPRHALLDFGAMPACGADACEVPRLPNLLLLPVNLASVASLGVVPAAQIAAQPLRDSRLPIDSDGIERDWFGEMVGLTWLMGPCGQPGSLWSATIGVE